MEGKEEDERTYNKQKNLRSSGPSVGFVISLRAGFLFERNCNGNTDARLDIRCQRPDVQRL